MAEQPLVSIIINCFNGEQFLAEALKSVRCQNYNNFEVIFWDNQSVDNSVKLYNEFSDQRWNYYYAPNHTTLYEARKLALEKCSGEFIAFLDVDDFWESEKLTKQIPLFSDPKVGLVYSNYWLLNQRKNRDRRLAYNYNLPEGQVLEKLLKQYVVGMPTIVIRKKALNGLSQIFDPQFQIIGDRDLATRLAIDWKFGCVQEPMATYRWHGRNLSIVDSGKDIEELEAWVESMKQYPQLLSNKAWISIADIITYKKTIYALVNGERLKAIYLFRRYPMSINKIRLFVALFIPTFLVDKLRN